MPRKARIDSAGALHHITVRGIERGVVFRDNDDRDRFVERLSGVLSETATQCFAWALIPNHFHLLLKTGTVPVGKVMQRLLTGYAVSYNNRHKRCGHLFQNRYKSILCQEDAYLLELVRYIHLNPLRAGIVANLSELELFSYCGHGALIGTCKHPWQNTGQILHLFSGKATEARERYRQFVKKGASTGRRDDLTGGGLIRSRGGWAQVIAMHRDNLFQKSDERILGDNEFVTQVLDQAQEQMERRYSLKARGINAEAVIERVCRALKMEKQDIFTPGKDRNRVVARSIFCYWAVRELGISQAECSRQLSISPAAVTQSVKRGERLIREKVAYSLYIKDDKETEKM